MTAFSALPGAVGDEHAISHFGQPLREQRMLERGRGIAELGDRVVVTLTGPERLSWLHSITSQSVAGLSVGVSTEFLILDVQGHVEHAASMIDDGVTSWLIVDRDDAQPLAAWLLKMRFRTQVEIEVRDDLAVYGFVSGGMGEKLMRAAQPLAIWDDPWGAVSIGGWQYAQPASHPGAEFDWHEAIVTTEVAEKLARSLRDVVAAGTLAADALRIAAWRPRWSGEARDGRLLPHEADWLRSAVHLDKGCYRGQETVAKVHNLGHPPRRMVMLHLDGSDAVLPVAGGSVLSQPADSGDGADSDAGTAPAEPREVGTVTSVAMHHELGPIALAIVSRRVPADETLLVDAGDTRITAAQEIIVPSDAGATANVPRLTRLSRRPLAES